jgi:hypothetical protein
MQVYGNLMNRIAEGCKMPKPERLMGATATLYTDRLAGTIVWVDDSQNPTRLMWQEDYAKRTDGNGMSDMGQTYVYERRPGNRLYEFKLLKRGWYSKELGAGLIIGERDKFHDFGF